MYGPLVLKDPSAIPAFHPTDCPVYRGRPVRKRKPRKAPCAVAPKRQRDTSDPVVPPPPSTPQPDVTGTAVPPTASPSPPAPVAGERRTEDDPRETPDFSLDDFGASGSLLDAYIPGLCLDEAYWVFGSPLLRADCCAPSSG
jgi:hypothetical protein